MAGSRLSLVSVLVADPDPVYRAGIVALLGEDRRFTVRAAQPADLPRACEDFPPDLAIIDPVRGGETDLATLIELRTVAPTTRIVLLTDVVSRDLLVELRDGRVASYLLKRAGIDLPLLRSVLCLVAQSAVSIASTAVMTELPAGLDVKGTVISGPLLELTERDSAILEGLTAGQSLERIALENGISARTVRRVVAELESEFGANSLFTLAKELIRLGLVS